MSDSEDPLDADALLDQAGFVSDQSVLTRRQAEVLALRVQGLSQAAIADRLGTSRANVSGIESSARENVENARETVAFMETLRAPVRISVDSGTDLYEVPQKVYDACDEAGVKVMHTAPDMMELINEAAGDCIQGRQVVEEILVGVTSDGEVRVRRQS
ncbi:MAG: Tfx family DNA-binding protein [Halobacteriales archaeon]|jgi:Tfx family DNA-binding protein